MWQQDADSGREGQTLGEVAATPIPVEAGEGHRGDGRGAGAGRGASGAGTARKGVGAGVVGLLLAAKIGLLKLLLTGGSALLSVVLYAARFGLAFAVGLVLLLLCHELGHWLAYRRKGITPDAMIFVPFLVLFPRGLFEAKGACDCGRMANDGPTAVG